MKPARALVESPRSVRWRLASLRTRTLYRAALGSLGQGSVIVRPHQLRGVE